MKLEEIDLEQLFKKHATTADSEKLRCLDLTEFRAAVREYESNFVENRVIASEQPKGVLANGAVAEIVNKYGFNGRIDMETLTRKEIDTLVDALEVWEAKDVGGEIIMTVLGAMLCKDDPEAKAKMEIEQNEHRKKMEMERRDRKETSLMLKAKLIQIKQNMLIDSANNILQH